MRNTDLKFKQQRPEYVVAEARLTGRRISAILCLCAAALAAIMLTMPVMADDTGANTQYMAGSPLLSAHIAGTNEFHPGDDLTIQVMIENSGVSQFKFVKAGILDSGDLSNTAKQLMVTLGGAGSPVTIKSDPQLLGDLPGSSALPASFHLTVSQDAAAGTYNLPVTLSYTYLSNAEQYGTDTLQYSYKSVNETVMIPLKIKPEVQLSVFAVGTKDLNGGNEGYVTLTVKNTGYENGTNAVMKIQQNPASPISPTEGSAFIGDFPAGDVVNGTFRVMVSGDTLQKTYPLDVLVNYKNTDGNYVDSSIETVGVPVGGKIGFNVTPVRTSISQGAKSVITVTFQNTGTSTAYNAEARISAISPFTSNDDTAFLGTMAPGDIRQASYDVSVDAGSTVKDYGLDSEVIYSDSLNNQFTSDPLKVPVNVVSARSAFDGPVLPGLVVVIALAAIGYFLYSRRGRAQ